MTLCCPRSKYLMEYFHFYNLMINTTLAHCKAFSSLNGYMIGCLVDRLLQGNCFSRSKPGSAFSWSRRHNFFPLQYRFSHWNTEISFFVWIPWHYLARFSWAWVAYSSIAITVDLADLDAGILDAFAGPCRCIQQLTCLCRPDFYFPSQYLITW